MIQLVSKCDLTGIIVVPSSKSDGQRAILAAALSKNITIIHAVGESDDEKSMLENIQKLGAHVTILSTSSTQIQGIQEFPNKASLNAGESGLGMRLITGVCAGHNGVFTIDGEGSLLQRPQLFFEEHLTQMGVRVVSNDGFLPLTVHGKLIGGELDIDGSASSQFLSGMLMSLPLVEQDSVLVVRNLKSIPYVQMTLNTLNSFGIDVNHENFERFMIPGNQHYNCKEYTVEGDWSAASYWLVASALGHHVSISGLNMESAQADKSLLDMLQMANCSIVFEENAISVDGSNRIPFHVDATHSPDLFPALVTMAAFCDGISTISGVDRLKNKESNRGIALQQEFEKLGLKIDLEGDKMTIHGGVKLHGAEVDSHNDHRIAMCLGIAAINLSGSTTIAGAESVSKSYPKFWEDLDGLAM